MKRIYTYMCLLLLSVLSFAVTGCDDDDDDDVAKDLIELIVNKPVIRIGQNEEAKVNVVVGNGNYTVRSFNTAIATATVSGELITVKSGSQNGATTVEVMDGEGVVANISVNVGVFELEVNEPEVILEVAGEKQLIVSMGNFSSNDELSYEVEDETVVSMVNTDQFRPFYTLTGLKNGHTTVTFTDHKGKQAVVQVTVNPISIDVSNLTPRVGVNNKIMITVEKGNGGYSLTAEDEEIVAIQQVDDTRFNLIGKKAGITTVFVRDEAEQELSLTVTVVQADKVANLGSGNYFKVPFEYNGTADATFLTVDAGKMMYLAKFSAHRYWNEANTQVTKFDLYGYCQEGEPAKNGSLDGWTLLGSYNYNPDSPSNFAEGDCITFEKEQAKQARYYRVNAIETWFVHSGSPDDWRARVYTFTEFRFWEYK